MGIHVLQKGDGVALVLLEEVEHVLALLDGLVVGLRDQVESLIELCLHSAAI